MDGLKTKELWGLSPRELELYLNLLSGSKADTLGEASRELSEIFGEPFWKNQVFTSLNNLRDMRLVDPQGFTPTTEAIEDILDRLTRLYGLSFDPAIRNVTDLGNDQRYFKVIMNGAEKALDAIGTRRRNLDEIGIVMMNEWMIGKLDSLDSTSKLSTKRREKIRATIELSTSSIIAGLSQEDLIYKTALLKLIFMTMSRLMRFIGRYTSAPPL